MRWISKKSFKVFRLENNYQKRVGRKLRSIITICRHNLHQSTSNDLRPHPPFLNLKQWAVKKRVCITFLRLIFYTSGLYDSKIQSSSPKALDRVSEKQGFKLQLFYFVVIAFFLQRNHEVFCHYLTDFRVVIFKTIKKTGLGPVYNFYKF